MHLPADFDLIIGSAWLKERRAKMDYGRECCELAHGAKDQRSTTVYSAVAAARNAAAADPQAASLNHILLTPADAFEELRRPGARAFSAHIRLQPEKGTSDAPAEGGAQPAAGEPDAAALEKIEKHAHDLIKLYWAVFGEPPPGLPKDRGTFNTIITEPGAVPPFRPVYRLSQPEYEDMCRQIEALLAKGLIRIRMPLTSGRYYGKSDERIWAMDAMEKQSLQDFLEVTAVDVAAAASAAAGAHMQPSFCRMSSDG